MARDGAREGARDTTPGPAPRRAPGLGDRWLAGEALPGVRFGLHDAVRVTEGAHEGRRGRVLLLARVTPAVEYVIAIEGLAPEGGGGELRVREAALAPA